MTGAYRLGMLAVVLATAILGVVARPAETAHAGNPLANVPPPGALRMQAQVGFDGQARVGGWTRLVADVMSDAPSAFSGELRVRVGSINTRNTYSAPPALYAVPVTVPARGHRRFSVDIRIPNVDSRVQATLVAADSEEVVVQQDVPVTRVPLGELFCGVVGRDARAYDFLAALDLPPPLRRMRVVQVTPSELPAVGHLLGAIDCLILDGLNTAQLRPEQLEALQVWLNGGGLLLTVGGTGWRSTLAALPPSLLPVEPVGLASVESLDSLEALTSAPMEQAGPWVVTRGRLREGVGAGRVLASQEGIPLVVAAKRGDGGAIYVAFDSATPALTSWPGQTSLWRYLLTHASIDSGTGSALVRPYLRWGGVPRTALADYSAQSRPHAGWLLVVSPLASVAAAGSVLFLGRRRRPRSAVAALVAIGMATTGAAFVLARTHAEPDVQVNQVSIIRPVALGEAAYTRTYVAAWPRRSGDFTFQLPPAALPYTLYYPQPRPSDQSDADWTTTTVETQVPQIRDLSLTLGTIGTFAFDSQVAASAARLEADLTLDGGTHVHGVVTNSLGQPLEDLALVVDTQALALGTLAPGQSVSIDASVAAEATTGFRAATALPNALLGEPPRNQPPSPRRDLLNTLFAQRYVNRRAELRGPTLVAWLPRDPLQVRVAGGGEAIISNWAILLAPARIRLPLGYHGAVPASILARRDLGGGPTFAPDQDYYTVSPGGSINLQFTLPPADGPWDIDDLLVNLKVQPTSGRLVPGRGAIDKVSLFNWKSGDWQDWQLGATTARIPEPERFVSATGDIRIRYRLDSGLGTIREVRVTRIDVTPLVRVTSG